MFRHTLIVVLVLSGASCTDAPSSDEQRSEATKQQAAGQDQSGVNEGPTSGISPAPVAPPPAAGSTPPRGSAMAELQAKGPIRLRPCTTLSGDEYAVCVQENAQKVSEIKDARIQQ